MTKSKKNTEDVQGTNTVPERKPSKLYAMRAFKAASTKLVKLDMISGEDRAHLERINGNLLNAYLMNDYDLDH